MYPRDVPHFMYPSKDFTSILCTNFINFTAMSSAESIQAHLQGLPEKLGVHGGSVTPETQCPHSYTTQTRAKHYLPADLLQKQAFQ